MSTQGGTRYLKVKGSSFDGCSKVEIVVSFYELFRTLWFLARGVSCDTNCGTRLSTFYGPNT